MAKILLDKQSRSNSLLVFDLEDDVLKPLRLGYLREAIARLDSIFDKVLEAKLIEKYNSKDARELIRLLSGSRLSSNLVLLAYKAGLISRAQKSKLEEFKSARNAILHDSFGELKVLLKSKNPTDSELRRLVLGYVDFLKSLASGKE